MNYKKINYQYFWQCGTSSTRKSFFLNMKSMITECTLCQQNAPYSFLGKKTLASLATWPFILLWLWCKTAGKFWNGIQYTVHRFLLVEEGNLQVISFNYSPPRPRIVLHYLYSITVWSAAPHCREAPGRDLNPGQVVYVL